MATQGSNRFALFAGGDDSEATTPISSPDPAKNPFLNQVADDSIPWEEVKRRNAPAKAAPPRSCPANVYSWPENISNYKVPEERSSDTSQSTTESNEKRSSDVYENWCGVCSLKFPSKAAILSHIKVSTDHQNYCNLCQRVFKDRNGLKNHVDNASGHETYCNICFSAFKDQWGLRNHLENNGSVRHDFVCWPCLLAFRTKAHFDRHMQMSDKHTWCGSCKRRFRNEQERDAHWQTTNRHKHCLQPGCDFDGPDEVSLTDHLKRDHYQCQGCKTIFASQTKLNQHHDMCFLPLYCPHFCETFAGKPLVDIHMKHCFACKECGFKTQDEEDFQTHRMAKHNCSEIVCWGCEALMPKYSSLVRHLESGNCPKLSDPTLLMQCLCKWWYSPLYMDLDIHASIRTGRVNTHEACKWMSEGVLQPFLCRANDTGCGKIFSHLSWLLQHCEDNACGWNVDRLNMPGLEKEFKRVYLGRDSDTC